MVFSRNPLQEEVLIIGLRGRCQAAPSENTHQHSDLESPKGLINLKKTHRQKLVIRIGEQPALLKGESASAFPASTRHLSGPQHLRWKEVSCSISGAVTDRHQLDFTVDLTKVATGEQCVGTDLPLVSSRLKQTEEREDATVWLDLLRNGTMEELQTIPLSTDTI